MPMEITTTTIFQTLSAYHQQPIRLSIEKRKARELAGKNIWNTLPESATSLLTGINQRKEGNGTGGKPRSQSQKTSQKRHVESAGECSSQKYKEQQCAAMSARESEPTSYNEKSIPVYDLMVEHDHEFFAYGVLVHNCIDALSMIAHLCEVTYQTEYNTGGYDPLDEISGI